MEATEKVSLLRACHSETKSKNLIFLEEDRSFTNAQDDIKRLFQWGNRIVRFFRLSF